MAIEHARRRLNRTWAPRLRGCFQFQPNVEVSGRSGRFRSTHHPKQDSFLTHVDRHVGPMSSEQQQSSRNRAPRRSRVGGDAQQEQPQESKTSGCGIAQRSDAISILAQSEPGSSLGVCARLALRARSACLSRSERRARARRQPRARTCVRLATVLDERGALFGLPSQHALLGRLHVHAGVLARGARASRVVEVGDSTRTRPRHPGGGVRAETPGRPARGRATRRTRERAGARQGAPGHSTPEGTKDEVARDVRRLADCTSVDPRSHRKGGRQQEQARGHTLVAPTPEGAAPAANRERPGMSGWRAGSLHTQRTHMQGHCRTAERLTQ